MSAAPQPASAWTEPPWSGWIETTGDALLILEAARRGLIPRVTRRLVDSERKMICSGSVFVFDEDESGIKRWTDGFFWSPSRILGNFLLYRETDKRGSSHRGSKSESSPENGEQSGDGSKPDGSLSRPKSDDTHLASTDKRIERTLMGSLTNSYKFKTDGLMKKTFSVTIGGVVQHLISYYKIEDVQNGRLRPPSSLPELASLDISPEYLDKTHFRNPPKVEIGADGVPRYRGEADEVDTSPPLLPTPLSPPLVSDGNVGDASSVTRRGKRFEPYAAPVAKRSRRSTKAGGSSSPPEQPAVHVPTSSASYVESTSVLTATAPHYPQSYGTTAPYGATSAYYPVPGYPPLAVHAQLPHVYYTSLTGSIPIQHTTPRGSVPYQYAYPASSTLSVSATHQPSSDTAQQQHAYMSVHPPQAYYPYSPQQHSGYPGAWPAYGYHTVPTAQQPPAHTAQSSIATAPEQTDAPPSTSSEGGDG